MVSYSLFSFSDILFSLRALEERGALEFIDGHIAIGWLLVKDLAMVIVLVLPPAMSHWLGGNRAFDVHQPLWIVIGLTIIKVSSINRVKTKQTKHLLHSADQNQR